MDEMRMMSIGLIGAGFSYRSFVKGLDMAPHVIGSDAGTSDLGPLSLGTGSFNRRTVKHDLDRLIQGARSIDVPFIIGSAGTAGGDPQVDGVGEIVREIAGERDLHLRMALLRAEVDKAYLKRKLAEGKIKPFGPVPSLTEDTILGSARIVGMMGVEPFMEALEQGANVIIGGRCTDPAIFAGPPLRAGFPEGVAWHAARTMDKGPMMTKPMQEGSCAFIHLRRDHFVASPTKDNCICTPQTIAAIGFYEEADPYHTVVPSGTLDTTECRFEPVDERSVRVTGAHFTPAQQYTIKLEGSRQVGFRSISIIGIRDPVLIAQLDPFLTDVRRTAERNLHIMGIDEDQYTIRFRVFGRDAIMGVNEPLVDHPSHEVGIVVEGVAEDQATATAAVGRHTAVAGHVEFEGRLTTAGNIAQPFPGGPIPMGPVFEWSVWHLLELDDWRETCSVDVVEV